jgi:hypothetical protein
MDLRNKKSTKIIRMVFIIIITTILVELVIAGILFFIEKTNQKNIYKINGTTKNEPIKLITEIEKEAILKKESSKIIKPEEIGEIDTNPRTRPLPKISF